MHTNQQATGIFKPGHQARKQAITPGQGEGESRQLRRPYGSSVVQDVSPHSHRNMWNVRPNSGSNMLAMKRGCLPHRVQGGQTGVCGLSINEQRADLDRDAS